MFEKLLRIRNSHFENLNDYKKKILIQNIILNLKLPELIKERELIKEKIISTQGSDTKSLMLKHEKITSEINTIRNKEI